MHEIYEQIGRLSLEESKELLLRLARDIFSVLQEEEKRDFIRKMAGSTGRDKLGSMVQL
jgi:hypothetical protein